MEIFENFTLPFSQNSSSILLAVIIETVFFIRLSIEQKWKILKWKILEIHSIFFKYHFGSDNQPKPM